MNAYRRNIYLYYAFAVLKDMFFVSAVLVVFFTDWGGISLFRVQLLQGWFMFWALIVEIPTGVVADRLGRKFSLILACLVGAAGALIYSITPNFYLFLFGEFLFAVCIALFSGADEAFVYDSLKKLKPTNIDKKAKHIFANMQIFTLISISSAAIIGSFFAARFGLQNTMRLVAGPLILAAFVGLLFKEPKTAVKRESVRYYHIMKDGWRYFISNKTLRIIALDTAIITSLAYFVIWLYQPKLQSIGIAIALFGFFHATLAISQIIWLKLMPRIEKRFKHTKTLITTSTILIGLSFLTAGIFNHVWVVIALFVFAGGLGMTRRTFMASFLNKKIPSRKRATVLSFVAMVRRFMLIGLNPLIGFIATRSVNLTLIILGATTLVVALVSPIKKRMFD